MGFEGLMTQAILCIASDYEPYVPELLTCICCVMITQVISIAHFFAQYFVLPYSTHPPTHSYRFPTPQRTPDVGPSPAVSGSAFSASQLRLGRRLAWLC